MNHSDERRQHLDEKSKAVVPGDSVYMRASEYCFDFFHIGKNSDKRCEHGRKHTMQKMPTTQLAIVV